jgi:predicted nuclease of predicted toxin-antitoxin system
MTLSVLADEHVNRVFITELSANGHDVAHVGTDYDRGTSDPDLLERATENDRIVLSNDADFARLHGEADHAGIVLYQEQNMSVTEFIQGINRVERVVPEPELRGTLVWLDEWID